MKEKVILITKTVVIAILAFVICCTQILYSVDKIFADAIYQTATTTNPQIKILAIDERTMQEYGDMKNWSRDVWADLVEILDQDKDNAPSVIAFDIMYVSESDAAADKRFAEACEKGGNVITAVNAVTKDKLSLQEDGSLLLDEMYVDMVEYPYEDLKAVTEYGFANTIQDKDGYIRYALWDMEHEGETLLSFAGKIYEKYCEKQGIEVRKPEMVSENVFGFTFSGKSGAYEVISLCDVLDGKIDARVFQDTIVLVGAYAPGMQDSYNVAIQKGAQMYGVEIHANILEAMMEGKTYVPVDGMAYAFVVMIVAVLFFVISRKAKLIPTTVIMVGLIGADIICAKMLYSRGYAVSILEFPVIILLIYAYHLITGYLTEIMRRRKVTNAFKKYVAPQVVEEISKQGDYKIVLGGENRHIAVLFVDIRGFTPMSESLQPEQVVEILNEYLSLTTSAIFKNGGTLDKFIGDATMAVFNAPFDLDDYIYRAVCTALDIAAGSDELEKKLMERFGKSVSFGIGVNCGPAVVGNIGCDFRMDYTAIGDTVNTAARLESNAKRGQILISKDVYEALKDRIDAEEIGVISLKGKKDGAFVYQVNGLK